MFHDTHGLGARHAPHNWEYADATARAAATGFVSADIGKTALQLDDYTTWILTAVTPTWSSSGASTLAVTADNVIAANALTIGNAGDRGVQSVAGLTTDGISRLQLGVIGGAVGGVEFRNATTGTVSLVPVTGALGTAILSLPAATGTVAVLATGVKQTFLPNATNAGINVGSVAGDPSALADGDVWLNSSGTPALRARVNGATVSIGSGAGDMLLGTAQTVTAAKTYNAGTLKIASGGDLVDANGNELFKFTATASAINEITLANGAAGTGPTLSMTGGDTDIDLNILTKANGGLNLNGPTRPILTFLKNGSGTAQIGTASGTNSIIAGSATDEWCFRSNASKRILFSTDNGSTFGLVVETGGDGISVVGATRPLLTLYKGTSGTGQLGTASGTDSILTGSTTDDFCFRSNASKSFLWSVDNGTSAALKIVASTGQVSCLKSTASTTTTTGSLINAGGFGNAGAIFNGGVIVTADTTDASSTTTGSVRTAGGLGVVKKAYLGDSLYFATSGKGINDANGNELFIFTATASAVNELTLANAATGTAPTLSATGGNTDIDLTLSAKGNGGLNLIGPTRPLFTLFKGASGTAQIGTASGTDSIITGSTTDDFCFRSNASKSILFSVDNATSAALKLTASTGVATFISSITTGAPSGGTAGAWKFGIRVAAAVVLDATQYIQLDVGGTLYKLGIVT